MLHFNVEPRDGPGLLRAMMRLLAGDAHISFEGFLGRMDFAPCGMPVPEEASVLRRQGIAAPPHDFLILPLEPDNEARIWLALRKSSELRRDSNLVHVQIAKGGQLAFGTYDGFHPECTWASEAVPEGEPDRLVRTGIVRAFARWTPLPPDPRPPA
jgi:hypothetical protein